MNLTDLEQMDQYGYPSNCIPPNAGPALRQAAHSLTELLTPASPEDRHKILMALRAGTITRAENQKEALASFKLLRAHLADFPLDILQRGCHAYINRHGARHFPRSAGELRPFLDGPLFARKRRISLLNRLADQCDAEDAERARLAADPLTPERAREILAEEGLAYADDPPPPRNPTVEDYLNLGLTPEEAEFTVCEGERARGRGRVGRSEPIARANSRSAE